LRAGKPEHVELGCDPSKNIYGISGTQVDDGRLLGVRMAGGHIHFGRPITPAETERCVKALDAIAGIVGVSLFASIDKPLRRKYYGLPGEYRLPVHGLEYRTLSNAWLAHPAVMHLTVDVAREAYRVGLNNYLQWWKAKEELVVDTILHHDVKTARQILTTNKVMLMGLLEWLYRQERNGYVLNGKENAEIAYNAILNGVESIVADPDNVEKNWLLNRPGEWATHSGSKGCQWGTAVLQLKNQKLL
jgi:hypothetical protein